MDEATTATDTAAPGTRNRISSVDILRGIVMMIMAIDHVRHFWSVTPFRPEDLTQTTGELFFTRWITHFCAPVFVFLSGVSIFFQSRRMPQKQLSSFLWKRGLWLILLQVIVLSFFLQFSFNMIILEVIWVLGLSMILMALIIKLPKKIIAVLAILIIFLHNTIPGFAVTSVGGLLLSVLHNTPAALPIAGGPVILVSYSVFPWVGVMAAGYVMGTFFDLPVATRNRRFRIAGIAMILLFLVLRFIDVYGDPAKWSVQDRGGFFTFLSFLNLSKYPPSLLFLLMTIGPACLILPSLDKASGKLADIAKVYGQVPFFFYLLHIPLIVLGSIIWAYFSFGQVLNLGFITPEQYPVGYEPSVARTYLVWLCYLILLYFPCKWYGKYKRTHDQWWLSYV